MPTTLQHRRYSTSALSSITGANGEIIIDSDKDVVTVHDGSTAGGFPLAPAGAYDQANNARNQANTARDQANNAYGEANLKLNLAGGTISGDLVVSGNLEVLGNTTTLNVETLSVEDNEIILNSNVTGAPTLNAFITINRGSANDVSVKWDEESGQWKWADDDQVYYAFDTALNAYAGANGAYAQANGAYGQANGAYGQANGAYAQANGAYAQANTAYGQANGAYDQANGAYGQANGAYGQANAAYNAANNAQVTVYANNASGKTTQFINFANTATIQVAVSADGSNANVEFVTIGDSSAATVQGAYGQANTARDQANNAYGQANAAYADSNTRVLKSGDTMTGNLTVNAFINTNNIFVNKKTTLQAPSNTNFNGERLRLYDFEEAGHPNYAIGVEGNYIWAGTDEDNGQTGFKWYGNTTLSGTLHSNSSFQVSNTVQGKVLKATGTGTAVDASSGNILTNKVTGTKFAFLAGANTVNVDAVGATANYTFTLPANSGLAGQLLVTDGSGLTTFSSDVYAHANIAYAQANTARDTANDAYGAANTANTNALNAYGQANSAYNAANNAQVTVYQNSASAVTTQKINFVNTATITVSVTNESGNANIEFTAVGGAAYDQANAAYNQANSARNQANTARDTANDAYGGANTANTNALNAYSQANTARDTANDAYGQANTARNTANDSYGQANTARDQANTARDTANSAYGEANLKLNLTGGTISGNLTVQGNLFLTGNATYINTASLIVDDSIIQLSKNSIADAVDIGFIGHYSPDGGTTNLHAGFIRHASDDIFYVFDGYPAEPTNNVIDIGSANLATFRANVLNAAHSVVVGGVNVLDTANGAYAQANGAYAHSNIVYAQANTARDQANTARDQANTARTTANDAYGAANTAQTNALGAYAHANIVYDQANTAYNQANSARDQANTARTTANDAYGQANTARDQANTARDTANNAYNTANNAVVASGGTATTLTLKAYREGINTRTITGSTVTADLSGNNIFDFTLQAAAVTITFTNAAASGNSHPVTVLLRQPGTAGNTVAYANTVNWSNAEVPTLASGIASRLDIISLVTVDGGTTFFAAHSMANVAY